MTLDDILTRPLDIGNGQNLTLKQIIEGGLSRPNDGGRGLFQSRMFIESLSALVEALSPDQKSDDPVSDEDRETMQDLARRLLVLDIIHTRYRSTSRPVPATDMLEEICERGSADPAIDELFGPAMERITVLRGALDILYREGSLAITYMGYIPSDAAAPSSERKGDAKPNDAVRELLNAIGLETRIRNVDLLDSVRQVASGAPVAPVAASIAGAAFGLYMASASRKKSKEGSNDHA